MKTKLLLRPLEAEPRIFLRLVDPAHPAQHHLQQERGLRIVRLAFQRTLVQFGGSFAIAAGNAEPCKGKVRVEAGGIELKRALESGGRLGATIAVGERHSPRCMGFGQVGIERQGLACGSEDFAQRLGDIVPAAESRIAIGDPGIGAGVGRIELDRLGEHLPRQHKEILGHVVEELAAFEIVSVSLDIGGRCLRDRLFFRWQQLDL